ncbi:N-6 DNA methylase [Chloroflexales bacterium ZM16-3]|nr:N-6 DNA methylase [Chloroflexales bacterium ZM16-3]
MTTLPSATPDFLAQFQHIFTRNGFRGGDFQTYLTKPTNQRSGDEASIVDRAIVAPLLDLLGFAPGDQNYNLQRRGDRPDYAPSVEVYGTCFVVESKNTTLTLTLDVHDPESNLGQLWGYMQLVAVDLGILTNGREIRLYERMGTTLREVMLLDMEPVLTAWASGAELPADLSDKITLIERMCSLASFTDPDRMERELGMDQDTWQKRALPLGTAERHEELLVTEVQQLIAALHADARQVLQRHRDAAAAYEHRRRYLNDGGEEEAEPKLAALRERVLAAIEAMRATLGLTDEHVASIQAILLNVIVEANAYPSKKALVDAVLAVVNQARAVKYAGQPRFARPWNDLEHAPNIKAAIDAYADVVATHLKRQSELRLSYRDTRVVMEDFAAWRSLVQETVIGGGTEEQQATEFALQAAYVIFIRLLLIRVCEDKGLFPNRFVSDGGLKHWQKDIERYLRFASGNPYAPLLDMAYANAQNIYAHFFTGREVFNWYRLDRRQLLMALHRLSRFNFAGVNADIVGTIYNTYVARKEKKERGQYYTPRPIVDYMLDAVGYTSGTEIIGPDKRLIDPACGSGSFLVAAAHRLVAAYQAAPQQPHPMQVLRRIRESLFGFDLNPFACYLAEVNLLIQSLDLVKQAHDQDVRQPLERFHIYNEDALTSPTAMFSYSRFQSRLAEESAEADQIKRRAPGTSYANGFAFVIANPPFGASLSDDYKATLRKDWADIFYGQPDTYVFFFALALKLLATRGRMAFITPNTYLMGTNTARLRRALLDAGRVDEIVDLPQGIWPDANVDCAITVLTHDSDETRRAAHRPEARLMGLRDDLGKLTRGEWQEVLIQDQGRWMADPSAAINIRYDTLLQRIEDACRIPSNGGTKVLRLGDVGDSMQGIIPYKTRADGTANLHIRPRMQLPNPAPKWHPLIDGSGFVGRYELRWGDEKPYLHYGDWLWCPRSPKYFDSPKLLFIRLRNRALKRRLVATYDDRGFYNRHNFSNIIARDDSGYNLKYILALFNSSLLNYWYARQFPDVEVAIDDTRKLPIFPADTATQAEMVALVDALLAEHAALNRLREQDYRIVRRATGDDSIELPYDRLLEELQAKNPEVAPYKLLDALYTGVIAIATEVDQTETVSSNIFVAPKHPTSVVLRRNKLWLTVPDADVRDYLVNYLSRPRWRGKRWADVAEEALILVREEDRSAFSALVQARQAEIVARLDRIDQIDQEIDRRVLALYGITDPAEQARVLGSAPDDGDEAGNSEPPSE